MSTRSGQAISARRDTANKRVPGKSRKHAIMQSDRYVALNASEKECFMSLPLDNCGYDYLDRFIQLAIECRQDEGLDHADISGLREDAVFYTAMFTLFSDTGHTAHKQGTVMHRFSHIVADPEFGTLFNQALLLNHFKGTGNDSLACRYSAENRT